MNDDELHAQLSDAGTAPVAPIDPASAARIESRLRIRHAQTADRGRRAVTWTVLGGVAAALMLAFALIGSTAPDTGLDATGVAGAPDIAGPGDVGDDDGGGTAPDAGDTGASDVDAEGDGDGRVDDDGTGADGPTDPDEDGAVDDAPDDPVVPPVDGTTTTTTTSAGGDGTDPTRPTPSTLPPEREPAHLRATARWRDGAALIVWDDPSVHVTRWTVVRTTRTDAGAESVVVRRSSDPALRRHLDRPASRAVVYVVRGLDEHGRVVVRSAEMHPADGAA